MGVSRHSKHELSNSEEHVYESPVKSAIALFSYTAKKSFELSFKQGDYLEIINDNDPDWWHARHLKNQQKGYVRSNYVYPLKFIGNEDWLIPRSPSDANEVCLTQNSQETSEKYPSSGIGPLACDQNDSEVPHNCLKNIQPIGKGSFGEILVYGFCNETCEVALKYLPTRRHIQPDDFRREVSTLKKIKHLHIVRILATCTEKKPFCIVMEYMCHGHLQQNLRSERGKQLKSVALVNIAAQIADGMKYLESEKLIHKSLAARNILVGKGDLVKLGDFGLEKILIEESYNEGRYQLFKWTSPETCRSGVFTIKSDVWSFGIVLYEIFTHGGTPYEGKSNDEVTTLLNSNLRLEKPDNPECSDLVYETMLFCWKKNPEDRPTFEYLCHFFEDYEETSYKSYYRIPFPARG